MKSLQLSALSYQLSVSLHASGNLPGTYEEEAGHEWHRMSATGKLQIGEAKALEEARALSEEVSKMLASFIEKLGRATKKLKADS